MDTLSEPCACTVDADHISTRRCFVAQAISPFNDVAAVTTPTLIVCGEKDWNVPVSQVDLRLPVTVVVAART